MKTETSTPPTVSEAMREGILHDEVQALIAVAKQKVAERDTRIAVLERENATLRAERDEAHENMRNWADRAAERCREADRLLGRAADAEAELATLRASAERMEAREQLDPELSAFMLATAARLTALAEAKAQARRDAFEEAAKLIGPHGPRPCDCEPWGCCCQNPSDTAAVAAWDQETALAASIRALATAPAEIVDTERNEA